MTLVTKRPGACALISRGAAEAQAGTAPEDGAHLLIEHAGPWPSAALTLLDPALLAELRARTGGARILLIRRAGGRPVERPRVYLAGRAAERAVGVAEGAAGAPVVDDDGGARPDATDVSGAAWIREYQLDSYEELRALDLEALAESRVAAGGAEPERPVFLVCTHGKRDACCAEFGRPLLATLGGATDSLGRRLDVWESSHVGGHRFAGLMVAFPEAYYYGRLNPLSALSAARDYVDGRLRLEDVRGRAGLHPAAQAAELALRAERGLRELSAVRVLRWAVGGDAGADGGVADGSVDRAEVTLRVGDQTMRVQLQGAAQPGQVIGSCGDESPASAALSWSIVESGT